MNCGSEHGAKAVHMWASFEVLKCKVSAFSRNTKGNLAITFSLLLIPLIGATGAAVDYSRASQVRTQMQSALDSSVLAGAIENAVETKIATAQKFFQAQVTNSWGPSPTVSFTYDQATKILHGVAEGGAKTRSPRFSASRVSR